MASRGFRCVGGTITESRRPVDLKSGSLFCFCFFFTRGISSDSSATYVKGRQYGFMGAALSAATALLHRGRTERLSCSVRKHPSPLSDMGHKKKGSFQRFKAKSNKSNCLCFACTSLFHFLFPYVRVALQEEAIAALRNCVRLSLSLLHPPVCGSCCFFLNHVRTKNRNGGPQRSHLLRAESLESQRSEPAECFGADEAVTPGASR